MRDLPIKGHPNLLVGIETSDDAGVYKINDELALTLWRTSRFHLDIFRVTQ